jgi:hypothetical protein
MPEPAPARQVLLVLGMHRSGTSATAGLLARLGAAPPATPMRASAFNLRGYYESMPLSALHDRLLAEAGSPWYDWGPLDPARLAATAGGTAEASLAAVFAAEYGDAPLVVLKDPRICRFVPLWRGVLARLGAAPKAVIPLRHPFEVAGSLARRDGMPLEQALLVWLRHCLDAEAATRDLPRCFFGYDDLIADWEAVVRRIGAALDLAWPVPPEAAADAGAFLSGDLRHHVFDPAAAAGPAFDGWVAACFDALGTLARRGGRDPGAEARLDAVREALDAAEPLAGALARRETAQATEMRARAEAAVAELEQARGLARAAAGAAQAAQGQAAAARRHADAAAAAEAARARAAARAVAAEARTEDAEAGLAEARAALARLEADLAGRDAALALQATELAALLGSTSWRLTAPLRRARDRLRRAQANGTASGDRS